MKVKLGDLTDTNAWSVLADWHEDQGDDEKAKQCRCISNRLASALKNGTIVLKGSSTSYRTETASQDET